VAQVKCHGVRAQEHLARYLPIAETRGNELGDLAFGIGQAVPARGRPLDSPPVVQPYSGSAQLSADSGHTRAITESLIQTVRLPKPGYCVVVAAAAGPRHAGVLDCAGASKRDLVLTGYQIKPDWIAFHEAADMLGGYADSAVRRSAAG